MNLVNLNVFLCFCVIKIIMSSDSLSEYEKLETALDKLVSANYNFHQKYIEFNRVPLTTEHTCHKLYCTECPKKDEIPKKQQINELKTLAIEGLDVACEVSKTLQDCREKNLDIGNLESLYNSESFKAAKHINLAAELKDDTDNSNPQH